MGSLVFGALRVAIVEHLPEVAHQLGMLRLLLLIQMREFLHLIRSNEVGVLLRRNHRLAGLGFGPVHIGGDEVEVRGKSGVETANSN